MFSRNTLTQGELFSLKSLKVYNSVHRNGWVGDPRQQSQLVFTRPDYDPKTYGAKTNGAICHIVIKERRIENCISSRKLKNGWEFFSKTNFQLKTIFLPKSETGINVKEATLDWL